MRITYAQLLTSARNRVHHVEVWVQAQQQLSVQTDIPESAIAVCCSDPKVSSIPLQDAELDDLLQLAVNCSDRLFVNGIIANMMPAQLKQPLAVHLLETATLRNHHEVQSRLLAMQVIQQLPTEEACRLVITAMKSADPGSEQAWSLLDKLQQLRSISSERLLVLMHAAIAHTRRGSGGTMRQLVDLPAAALISPAELNELLRAAILRCKAYSSHRAFASPDLFHELLRVPAIAQIAPSAVVELLQLALQTDMTSVKYLGSILYSKCLIPAAAIDTEAVVQLLMAGATTETALLDGYNGYDRYSSGYKMVVIKGMCNAPSTQRLSASQLEPVLLGLLQFLRNFFQAERGLNILQIFCKLPATAHMSSDVL